MVTATPLSPSPSKTGTLYYFWMLNSRLVVELPFVNFALKAAKTFKIDILDKFKIILIHKKMVLFETLHKLEVRGVHIGESILNRCMGHKFDNNISGSNLDCYEVNVRCVLRFSL